MVDYNASLPQLQMYEGPNLLAMAQQQQQNQLQRQQADMQMRGMAQTQQMNDLKMQEFQRAKAQAAASAATGLKEKADILKILGGINQPTNALVPAAAPAANGLAVPLMGFGADVGSFTPGAEAAPTTKPAAAAAPSGPDYSSAISQLVQNGHVEVAKSLADLAGKTSDNVSKNADSQSKIYDNSYKQF
jgi:hypothetical protein